MKPKTQDPDFWWKMLDRRQLLKVLGAAGSVMALEGSRGLAEAMGQIYPVESAGPSAIANAATGEIPKRMLGKTGEQVSALCFGGAHWGRMDSEAEAIRVLHEALEAGVTFLDNAWEYNGGRSEELMGKALQGRRQQAFLMTKVCSHGRDKRVALQQLDESLRRLKTDYLDLWQIHEVVYDDDPDRHFAPNGAADALLEAKRQGKVRFLGFTGHKDPKIHLKMLAHDFPFDTCQMPLNVFDGTYRSFAQEVLPVLMQRGIAAPRHEIAQWQRRTDQAGYRHRGRSLALCVEPAGRLPGQRHRFTAGLAAESRHRAALHAHDRCRDGDLAHPRRALLHGRAVRAIQILQGLRWPHRARTARAVMKKSVHSRQNVAE